MRIVNVSNLEACTVSRKTAGAEGGKTALMSKLGKRVYLIHELRQRRGAEELLYRHHDGADIYESLGSDVLLLLLRLKGHSLAHDSLHSRHSDSELVLEQLAHAADTSVAEVVDIVRCAYLVCKAVDIVYG